MKYKVYIAGIEAFYTKDFEIDISPPASVKTDFQTWEEEKSGFEFSIPRNWVTKSGKFILIPEYFSDTSDPNYVKTDLLGAYRSGVVYEDVFRWDTQLAVNDKDDFVKDNYYWIKNELIKVTGLNSSGGVDWIDVDRGQLDTFQQNYVTSILGLKYQISSDIQLLDGQIVLLKNLESTPKIEFVGIIEGEPKYQNGMINFSCTDAWEKLGYSIPIYSYQDSPEMAKTFYFDILSDLSLDTDWKFFGELPPVIDYLDISTLPLTGEGFAYGFNKDTFENYAEAIDYIRKRLRRYVVFNRVTQKYEFQQWNLISDQYGILDIADIRKYIKNGEYSVEKFWGLSRLEIKTSQNSYIYQNPRANAVGVGRCFELEIPEGVFGEPLELNSFVTTMFATVGEILSKLTVKTDRALARDFEVGKPYNLEYIDKSNIDSIYTLQLVSDIAICAGIDKDEIEFLIIDKDKRVNPLAPSLFFEVTNTILTNYELTFDDAYGDIQEFLLTSESSIELASVTETEYLYFAPGQKFICEDETGSRIADISIIDISLNTMEVQVTSGSISVTDKFWLIPAKYADAGSVQRAWVYIDHSVY